MRRIPMVIAAAAILVATVGGGSTGHASTPPTNLPAVSQPTSLSAEAMAGIWINTHGGPIEARHVVVRFDVDGEARFDCCGGLDTDPAVIATYEIDGDRINFAAVGGWFCVGASWTWETTIHADGRLAVANSPGGCGFFGHIDWVRLSPESPAGIAYTSSDTAGTGGPSNEPDLSSGIWLRQGTGQLLHLYDDGTYTVDDDGELGVDNDDTGTYQRDGTTITFTSTGSADCTGGDTVTWVDITTDYVRLDDDPSFTTALHTTTDSEPTCPVFPTGFQTWMGVSP